MFKKGIAALFSMILLLSVTLVDTNNVQAGYTDNPSRLYFDLSNQAYKVGISSDDDIKAYINKYHGGGRDDKYEVIASVDVNTQPNHPMGKPVYGLDKSGFKALAVVKKPSSGSPEGKVFIAFAGTQDDEEHSDAKNALVSLNENPPAQSYHAHLFLNWLYLQNPTYQNYKWYFTGHSLGGWLASKTYLDVRSARSLVNIEPFTNRGPIKKDKISGVYTFNALPVSKAQMGSTQWNANIKGTYNTDVKNLFIDNEWLNSIYDMHDDKIEYVGVKGAVNKGIPYYTANLYFPTSLAFNLIDYWVFNKYNMIVEYHSLKYLKSSTYH
ncbi:hypothetical protein [Bacillus sp. AG4(2022)]|uniref:hypothetical protein n=1 Tax=Bacillus sp. AG4(2022) TaxID=2962594 RepID=UPI002881903B|nr:hypothetical protein [Bacillus sp. AG4(2022)]MDT0161633.1 hypothetical protein [Bacillus sp. AG4(2022)]